MFNTDRKIAMNEENMKITNERVPVTSGANEQSLLVYGVQSQQRQPNQHHTFTICIMALDINDSYSPAPDG